MKGPLGLIVNPHARRSKEVGVIEKLKACMPPSSPVWVPQSLSELDQVTLEAHHVGIETLFVFGGDGTFRTTVQSYIHQNISLPKFFILQGGTANLYSKHYSGPKHPVPHLTRAIHRYHQGIPFDVKEINILRVNNRYYGFVFFLGGFAHFLDQYLDHPSPSLSVANRLVAKVTASYLFRTPLYREIFNPFSIRQIAPEPKVLNASTLACASIPVGYILHPFYGIQPQKTFSALWIQDSPFWLLRSLTKLAKRELIQNRKILQQAIPRLEIEVEHPLLSIMDGDRVHHGRNFLIELGPLIQLAI